MVIEHKLTPNTPEELLNILHPLVRQWFTTKFPSFALPQLYSIMEIQSRKNILISSPTGSGKTLTSFLAILNELVDNSLKGILENKVYCLYISPLKALSRDIEKNLLEPLEELEVLHGSPLGIRVGVKTGDTSTKEKVAMLKAPPHIFITTPESLGIALTSPKFRLFLTSIDWCIIDEVHALADNKRGVDLSLSLERLQYLSPALTRIGLSATVAPIEDIGAYLVGRERDCVIVNVAFLKELDLQVVSPVSDLMETGHEEMHNAMYDLLHRYISDHKPTLVCTNTRAATERVVHYLKDKFPSEYTENIGAHHGSLSAEHRRDLEANLRAGKLKVVVCSTSLELGIDIGFIDLVVLLGSPKSVARCLQRVGRSGHQLHATTKGRIIVLDRDDLVECSVLLKCALEKKIDKIHIPRNCLDVLAQQIIGMAVEQEWHEETMLEILRRSYCFLDLSRTDFFDLLDFLSGKYIDLEDRHVYARIYHENNHVRKRGKLARMIYMTNLGTIPDQSGIRVKIGDKIVGSIDEAFLERLHKGDIFVLGGNVYEFRSARGMSIDVNDSSAKPPTVPSWMSDSLPLSFDLALSIGVFRGLVYEKFQVSSSKEEMLHFFLSYLSIDAVAAEALYGYCKEQFDYVGVIPHTREIVLETYWDEKRHYYIFHSLYGRRVNDVLSRALAFGIGRILHRDVDIGISDNGFYVSSVQKVDVLKVLRMMKTDDLEKIMLMAIDRTEILRRRFRHCAARAFMILKNYRGVSKTAGRQQVNSQILLNTVRSISEQFPILREARREVLEDCMDIENAKIILSKIEKKEILFRSISTTLPSPFALRIVLAGSLDVMKIEDRMEFLRNMHQMVQAKISLKK